ncbi:MAG: hypothetical protein J0J06_14730 [Sphingomonas sp.]|uniref:hypothetical protein n=1 Tax=Sphingomonas sp. TaxID=28214 RepID=UPI001AD5E725|nr:hypothetical protein [Sphingomonas sp.]MBN8816690.1 hypothetical protein [Sphingomonas sp.]
MPPHLSVAITPVVALLLAQPAGGTYELRLERTSAEKTADDKSTSSSFDRDTVLERVVAVRDDGIELEYDNPSGSTDDDRARNWLLPFRVFRPRAGPTLLLNADELASRADPWLKRFKMTRAACGQWGFSWTAYKVDCDPQSALAIAERFDLWGDVGDGVPYRYPGTLAASPLHRVAIGPEGSRYTVDLAIDADAYRRERADADVAIGTIMRKPVTLADALRQRAAMTVVGTVKVAFDTDAAGRVRRRTVTTTLVTREPGETERTTTTVETLDRLPAQTK